ncbi:hypothetical protein [Pseudomonas aeruginosa]|uniref:hypothetical protein n=1 Tax=Pseudomonas aeruginosa TaxID=287 RepID=UPI0019D4D610|nr:hypothetical protein [Pseudomonas aeruginosa]
MNKANECTCPSGDGSLVHPCPAHPAVEQAGGDERAADAKPCATRCPDCGEHDLMPGDLCACGYETDPATGYACSECDGSGEGCVGEVCRECDGSGWFVTPDQASAALAQPSPAQAEQHWPKLEKPAQVGAIRFRAGLSSRLVVEAAQRLYEFESTPEKEAERIERLQAFREQCFEPLGAEFSKVLSENLVELSSEAKPEQAEAERPEVVARVVHSNPVVLGQCGPLNANDELMTVAQHAASVARWAEMFNRVEQERDAALARLAELELKLDKSDYAYDNDRIHMRGLAARAIARAKVFDDGSDGADAESARSVVAILRELLAVGPAQAQHSVPDGASDLCRFLAKLYCELDGLRYSTAKLPAEQIADALIFKWPVLQGARNQLNIKRISEQPYDESKLHSAIAAMLAAAPGKEGV